MSHIHFLEWRNAWKFCAWTVAWRAGLSQPRWRAFLVEIKREAGGTLTLTIDGQFSFRSLGGFVRNVYTLTGKNLEEGGPRVDVDLGPVLTWLDG